MSLSIGAFGRITFISCKGKVGNPKLSHVRKIIVKKRCVYRQNPAKPRPIKRLLLFPERGWEGKNFRLQETDIFRSGLNVVFVLMLKIVNKSLVECIKVLLFAPATVSRFFTSW
jgi:hypothetical protein